MAKKHRSRTDMIAAVLEAAKGGSNFTRIMFSAYMSCRQCTDYIDLVSKTELLQFDKSSRKYSTTQKGKQFLGMYEKIKI